MQSKHLPVLFLLTSMLAACGGGGGGGGAPADAGALVPEGTPNLATNSTAALFEADGVFFFGGAGSSLGGVDQAYIRQVRNGSTNGLDTTTLAITRYAGADSFLGNTLLDELPRYLFSASGGNYLSTTYVDYLADGSTRIGSTPWRLGVTLADLAGSSIDAYRLQARSGTNAPAVTGNFSAGAQSVRLRYTASSELLAWPGSYTVGLSAGLGVSVNEVADLPATLCFRNTAAGTSLRLRLYADGSTSFHKFTASSACSGTEPAAAATGTYTQQSLGDITYLEVPFPASIPQADHDTTFTAAEFASGITFALVQPADGGNWQLAYHFAANAWTEDPVLHMNKQAADDLKTALGLAP